MGAQTTEQPDSVGCLTIDIVQQYVRLLTIFDLLARGILDFSLFVDFSAETQVSL